MIRKGYIVFFAIRGYLYLPSGTINKTILYNLPLPQQYVRFVLTAANSSHGAIEISITTKGSVELFYCSKSLVGETPYVQGTITYIIN